MWPWLVQMGGYTRAGWYGYDWIDDAGRQSVTRIGPRSPTVRALAFTAAIDIGDFVMFRRMLLGIRERAERLARSRCSSGILPA